MATSFNLIDMRRQNGMTNYLRIGRAPLRREKFVFVDTKELLSAKLFVDAGIKINRVKIIAKADSPFRLIFCRIRKKQVDRFLETLATLRDHALLFGYRDYDEMCELLNQCEKDLAPE